MVTLISTGTYLIFRRNRARFAVSADAVREILNLPELTPPSHPRPAIVGLVHLRGKVVPVMDLDIRLGLPPQFPYRVSDRLVVLEWEGVLTGIVVSEVVDVTPLNSANVTRTDEVGHFATGVASLNGEMVVVLDLVRLLLRPKQAPDATRNGQGTEHLDSALLTILPDNITDPAPAAQAIFQKRKLELTLHSQQSEATVELRTLAIVGLNDERIGIPIEGVREFSPIREITPVPGCPEHIRGLMNLRGELLALVDIRSVLHLPSSENDGQQTAVIVQSQELRLGIVVDAVMDVVTILDSSIHNVGSAAPSRMNGFVQGTAYHNNTLFSILDLDRILKEGGLVVDEAASALF